MPFILDTATLKENLYVTNLKLSTPPKQISIKPEDLLDDEIVLAWTKEGARCSFSLKIGKLVSEFVDRQSVRRRDITSHMMHDGSNFLLFESNLNQYLLDCKELDDLFAVELEELLLQWESIRDDFEGILHEKMTTAVTKSSPNKILTTELETTVEENLVYYMTHKFPTEDDIRDSCGVIYDTPRLFKSQAPTGLSPEAMEAYEKSQVENTKIIYELLIKDYQVLEIDVSIGFLDDLISQYNSTSSTEGLQIKIFNSSIIHAIQNPVVISANQEETESQQETSDFKLFDDDSNNSHEKSKETSNDTNNIDIKANLAQLKKQVGAKETSRYNINSYRRMLGKSKSLVDNIINSLPILSKVIDQPKLDDLTDMLHNTKTFVEWNQQYVDEYEQTQVQKAETKGTRTKSKSLTIDTNQEINHDMGELVEVEPISEETHLVEVAVPQESDSHQLDYIDVQVTNEDIQLF